MTLYVVEYHRGPADFFEVAFSDDEGGLNTAIETAKKTAEGGQWPWDGKNHRWVNPATIRFIKVVTREQ